MSTETETCLVTPCVHTTVQRHQVLLTAWTRDKMHRNVTVQRDNGNQNWQTDPPRFMSGVNMAVLNGRPWILWQIPFNFSHTPQLGLQWPLDTTTDCLCVCAPLSANNVERYITVRKLLVTIFDTVAVFISWETQAHWVDTSVKKWLRHRDRWPATLLPQRQLNEHTHTSEKKIRT